MCRERKHEEWTIPEKQTDRPGSEGEALPLPSVGVQYHFSAFRLRSSVASVGEQGTTSECLLGSPRGGCERVGIS